MEVAKAALIGYGGWGRILEKYMHSSSAFELKYIHKPSPIVHTLYVPDIETILSDQDVEWVFVAVPIDQLAAITRRCLDAKKNVFCEKPLSYDPSEVTSLYQLARAHHRRLYTNYIYTHAPTVKHMGEVLRAKAEVRHIQMHMSQYGKFYKDSNAMDVIGCHLASILPYWFSQWDLEAVDIKVMPSDDAGQDVSLYFGMDGCRVVIRANLISLDKSRQVQLTLSDGSIMKFSPMAEPTYEYWDVREGVLTRLEDAHFDEFNNLEKVFHFIGHYTPDEMARNERITIQVAHVLRKVRDAIR